MLAVLTILHQLVMPGVPLQACCLLHLFDQPTDCTLRWAQLLQSLLARHFGMSSRPRLRVKQTTSANAGCLMLPHLPSQLLRSDEGAEYSAMDATADGNTAYLADKDGAVEVVDTRQAADAKPAAVSCSQTATKHRACTFGELWKTLSLADKDGAVEVVDKRQTAGAEHAAVRRGLDGWVALECLSGFVVENATFCKAACGCDCGVTTCRMPLCQVPSRSCRRRHLCIQMHRRLTRVFGWLQEISLHEKRINTIHLEPGSEQLLVTSVGNGTVALWDTRKLAKGAQPMAAGGHSYSCQAAYFAPDGDILCVSQNRMQIVGPCPPAWVQPMSPWHKLRALPMHRRHVFSSSVPCRRRMLSRVWKLKPRVSHTAGSQRIVSTSRDNTLRIWDARKDLAPGPVMKHNNNTGRPTVRKVSKSLLTEGHLAPGKANLMI